MTAAAPPGRISALPCWVGEITAEPLAGGLSNEIWKVVDGRGAHVVRFGTDYPFHHVSRAHEVMSARAAHAAGLAPAVQYNAPGVMVSAFIEARTWEGPDLCAAPERVGRLLAAFHRDMPAQVFGPAPVFWVFHVIRDYARTLAGSAWAPGLAGWLALAAELEAEQIALPIIYGHHDLLPANLLDDGARLWLIDFEYAGFGTAMFDLASAAANAGMDPAQSRRLLTAYLGAAPTPPFARAFSAMQCAALLREAMWAMVSQLHLTTEGVDFGAYADENLAALDTALALHRARSQQDTA